MKSIYSSEEHPDDLTIEHVSLQYKNMDQRCAQNLVLVELQK